MLSVLLICAITTAQTWAHPHRRHQGDPGPLTCNRVLFGTVNESFPDHIHRNGIYRQLNVEYNGLPVFKHETQDEYLYNQELSRGPGQRFANWVIGKQPNIDEPEIQLSVGPLLGGRWEVKLNEQWVPVPSTAKAYCMDDIEMTTCTSGKLLLEDITDHNRKLHEKRLGTYLLTSITHHLRPVYQHLETKEFLYFQSGMWYIGFDVAGYNFSMFAVDDAFKPEFIVQTWVVTRWMGREGFVESDPNIRFICEGIGEDQSDSNGPGENQPLPLPGWDTPGSILPERESLEIPTRGCDDVNCQNNGTCSVTITGGYLCNCKPGYFGQLCERVIRCSPPPMIRNGYITAYQKEWSFLDVVIYKCRSNGYMMRGDSGSVCQADRTWSRPPKCFRLFTISPEVPVFPRLPNRRRSLG